MQKKNIELILSEFGYFRQNAGGNNFLNTDRLEPTLSTFLKQFPYAKITLYTDFEYKQSNINTDIDIIKVKPPFDQAHPRYGWRSHDYYQAYGLIKSTADYAIAMDTDMKIVSDKFKSILKLSDYFGLCLPANPRLLIHVDGTKGTDSAYIENDDLTQGQGFAYNLTPIAFNTKHHKARELLELYCEKLKQMPQRGCISLFEAACKLQFSPYMLPFQWCVCSPRDLDSKHIWGNEIVLHVGHPDVYPYYLKQQKIQARKALFKKIKNKLKGK